MKLVFLISFLSLTFSLSAQRGSYIETGLNVYGRETVMDKNRQVQSTLKPYHPVDRKSLNSQKTGDTLKHIPPKTFTIIPLADIQTGYRFADSSDVILNNSLGFGLHAVPSEKWTINANYLFGNWHGGFAGEQADSINVVPGMGYAFPQSSGYISHTLFGSVNYNPNRFFSFELGNNKHFIGNGYRSLLLSDNASPYPYFKIDTKIWRIRYTNIYSWLYDIRFANGNRADYYNKFSTTHFLEWNATKRWSLGLFESIIWQGKDTLLNRGYDVNYLNPVIFYRPVEFAQGSADNAVIGLNSTVNLTDHVQWYTQFVLDEFLLDEFKSDIKHFLNKSDTTIDYGWWANKYAIQIGLKWFQIGGIHGLDVLTEFNLVRPFMFTHGSVYQNYGHMNQSLTHPRGANFYEWITTVNYSFDKWIVKNTFIWSLYGTDGANVNYGGDIYQSYQNRQGTYGHTIGQGVRNVLLFNDISLNRYFPQYYLDAGLGYNLRMLSTDGQQSTSHLIYIRLKSRLFNRYYDY